MYREREREREIMIQSACPSFMQCCCAPFARSGTFYLSSERERTGTNDNSITTPLCSNFYPTFFVVAVSVHGFRIENVQDSKSYPSSTDTEAKLSSADRN